MCSQEDQEDQEHDTWTKEHDNIDMTLFGILQCPGLLYTECFSSKYGKHGLRQNLTEGYKKMWKWERTITALSSIKNMVAIYFPHHAKDQGKFHSNSFTDQCSEYILCKTVMQRYFWKKTTSEHFKLLSVQKHWAINEKC